MPDNIVLLCGDGTQLCHGWVTDHPSAAKETGYHVPAWQSLEETPIFIHFDRWVLLLPNGSYEQSDSNQEKQ